MSEDLATVLVTGANGLVGARTCSALLDRGAEVRALVRRPGAAPAGTVEVVGEVTDPGSWGEALRGVDAVVSTVHPMGSDRDAQHAVGVVATRDLAGAAREAGVTRLVHVSTAAVYDRSPGADDVDESSPLVGDDGGDYPVTKRDAERALADVTGLTRVVIRPPAILGPGKTSVWNTLRPAAVRDDPDARRTNPDRSWPWVHVSDLATLAADVASGRVATSTDPDGGPVDGGCTAVNVAGEPATWRDYLTAVAGALEVEPEWTTEPGWTGRLATSRAHGWGWWPQVSLADALQELVDGLASSGH